MIVAIDFVDEGDARLGVLVSAGDDTVPDVRSVDKSRRGRLFNQSIGKIGRLERFLIAEGHGRAVGTAIDDVIAAGDRIENRIVPAFAFEFKLIPFVLLYGIEELVGDVD